VNRQAAAWCPFAALIARLPLQVVLLVLVARVALRARRGGP
jgi:uncharacterized membrane protein